MSACDSIDVLSRVDRVKTPTLDFRLFLLTSSQAVNLPMTPLSDIIQYLTRGPRSRDYISVSYLYTSK